MYIYIASISGGFMPNQIGIISLLSQVGYRPDVGLGASGGNMALGISLMCDWNPAAIRAAVSRMSDELVVKPWSPPQLRFLPNAIWGLIRGSLYDRSTQDPFMVKSQNIDLSTACEIWSLTFSKTHNSAKLFTNRSCGTTKLTYTTSHINTQPLQYISGDYALFRDIAMASAAVPGVQREVIINDEEHADGGLLFASPFPVFSNNIRDLCKQNDVHLVYVAAFNESRPSHESLTTGVIADGIWAMRVLTEAACRADLAGVISFLYSVPSFNHDTDTVHHKFLTGTLDNLRYAKTELDKTKASVLEIRPKYNRSVDYTSFSPEDFISVVDLAQEHFEIRMYWIGKK